MYLVACDYDGTLKIDGEVKEVDIDAISKFRALGNKFVICTGRTINSVYHQLLEHEIPFDYIIGVNGAVAIDPDYQVLYSHSFDHKIFHDIQSEISKFEIRNYQISNGFDYVNVSGNNQPDKRKVDISAIRGYFFITEEPNSAASIADYLNNKLNKKGITAYSNNNFVAVGVSGIHKAHGVENLASKINWQGKIVAIGDDFNDIPMFKHFESYGIKTGYPDAIKYAKHKASSVYEVLNIITKGKV